MDKGGLRHAVRLGAERGKKLLGVRLQALDVPGLLGTHRALAVKGLCVGSETILISSSASE